MYSQHHPKIHKHQPLQAQRHAATSVVPSTSLRIRQTSTTAQISQRLAAM
jgi:hypothetical protein